MSFRTSCPVVSSPFELLRRSFLQADGLPFGDALSADQIEQAFAAEGVSFGQPGGGGQPPIYTMALTLWAMLSQALFTDLQRSCRAAVLRVAVYYTLLGRQVSTNTGAYCRARAKISEGVVRRRMHQLRQLDFRRGRRLGAKDHVVTWKKPQRPKWMDQETYDSLPAELEVRETHVAVRIPGFRTESLVVVSSFLDDEVVGAEDLADLYRQRWRVEVCQPECNSSAILYRLAA